jgi:hypothetical protein
MWNGNTLLAKQTQNFHKSRIAFTTVLEEQKHIITLQASVRKEKEKIQLSVSGAIWNNSPYYDTVYS